MAIERERFRGIARNGRIELEAGVELEDGTEVIVLPVGQEGPLLRETEGRLSANDFWRSADYAVLARSQGIGPIDDIAEWLSGLPTDSNAGDLAAIIVGDRKERRDEGRRRSA